MCQEMGAFQFPPGLREKYTVLPCLYITCAQRGDPGVCSLHLMDFWVYFHQHQAKNASSFKVSTLLQGFKLGVQRTVK